VRVLLWSLNFCFNCFPRLLLPHKCLKHNWDSWCLLIIVLSVSCCRSLFLHLLKCTVDKPKISAVKQKIGLLQGWQMIFGWCSRYLNDSEDVSKEDHLSIISLWRTCVNLIMLLGAFEVDVIKHPWPFPMSVEWIT
jgi:hypothetical protein